MKNIFYRITNKSFEEMGVSTQKELWEKVKTEYKGLSVELPISFEKSIVKKEETETEILTMVFSTPDKDRHGDIVIQNWILDGYKANPVLLDSHNYDSITHIVGKVNNMRIDGEKLKGEIEFALMNPKGVLAKEMADNGFLNASSAGFIPNEFDNEGRILKSELLEVSFVSVPANAKALFEKKVKEIESETETLKKEIEVKAIGEFMKTKEVIDTKKEMLKIMLKAIKEIENDEMSESQKEKLFTITKALKNIDERGLRNNLSEKKRFLFSALRSL